MKRLLHTLPVGLGIILTSGCHDSHYESEYARREANIHANWTAYMERESASPINIEKLNATAEELQKLYNSRLEKTLKMINERSRQRRDDWMANEENRKKPFEKNAEGDLTNIEKTWLELTP